MPKTKQKPSLLFLHGLGLSGSSYRHGLQLLSDEYEVYAPNMMNGVLRPGLSCFAERVVKQIKKRGMDTPLYVVGHSMGGGVAVRLAYEHPELVKGMVLMNSIGARDEASVAHRLLTIMGTTWPGIKEVVPITETMLLNIARHPLGMAALTLGEIRTGDLESEARAEGRRHIPAVVIHADGDHVIDYAHSERLARLLQTPLREVHGNHDWMFHNWPFFAETIRESVRDLKKQKSATTRTKNRTGTSPRVAA